MVMMNPPSYLTDEQLVGEVKRLAACERTATAELVGHLAEMESRQLYLAAGFNSLFTYCREVLHLPEDATCNRTTAVRMVRAFPTVLPMLADGRLNLSTLRLLAPYLTADNHAELLGQASYKSKREVDELIARWFPKADVATSIRKRPMIEPLAEDRYLIKFTVSGAMLARLRQAQDLLRHAVPNGDAAEIYDRGLISLLDAQARRKFAATDRPHASRGTKAGSRDVPAAVKRAVWLRDGGQCAFAGHGGRRCEERGFLEFHHLVPYIASGEATVENIALRCRMHNQYESDLFFAPIRADMSAHHSTRPGAG
jgi:hypothetical protein